MKHILYALIFLSVVVNVNAAHKKHHHGKSHLHHHKKSFDYMRGVASFYGDNDGFDGQIMANGKVFDQLNVHSAAHPTLPLGTKISVTNLSNNRTIYVVVRDRMPKKHGRVIDLSTAAAKYLGMYHHGITRVQLRKVSNKYYSAHKDYLEVDQNDTGQQQ
jgi:rare lipoprotein A